MLKNNKGITLVALVVTIVILLILAGVSLNLVLGDNGIVRKAQEAREKTEEADARDKVELAIAEYPLASDGQSFEDFLNSKVPKDFDEVKKNEDGNFEIKKGKYTITVDDQGNIKDVSKTGPTIKVENIRVVANKDGSGDNLEKQSLENGETAYINFESSVLGGTTSVDKKLPFAVTANGEYTFTITAKVGRDKFTKEVKVTVNQFYSLELGTAKVVANEDGSGENITGQVLNKKKLYINFDVNTDRENITVSPQIPYGITGNGNYTFTITAEGTQNTKTVNVTVDQYLPESDITKPYLPGDGFSYVSGTDVDNGLVAQDGSGNQYVWVEVPRTGDVYQTAWLNITNFTDTDYANIESDLHEYTAVYRNNTDYVDVFSSDTSDGWFSNDSEYTTAKRKMLKSVYENGGFYIGRYEAGISKFRTEPGNATEIPVSKANAYPYTFIRRTEAKKLAEKVNHGSHTSSLMYGVQWDLALAFMKDKGGATDSTLTEDSKSIGNYKNNPWNITNSSAKHSDNDGGSFPSCPYKKPDNAYALLTTGADASFSVKNIYDMAGNVWEWTLEGKPENDDQYPCVIRGGCYQNVGSEGTANNRNSNNGAFYGSTVGFRVVIY